MNRLLKPKKEKHELHLLAMKKSETKDIVKKEVTIFFLFDWVSIIRKQWKTAKLFLEDFLILTHLGRHPGCPVLTGNEILRHHVLVKDSFVLVSFCSILSNSLLYWANFNQLTFKRSDSLRKYIDTLFMYFAHRNSSFLLHPLIAFLKRHC